MKNVLAFDLEIVKDIPEGEDWKNVRPLGISCASTMKPGEKPIVWYHGMQEETPLAGAMTKEELKAMMDYILNEYAFNNTKLLTWNGLGFDMNVLAEESGMLSECIKLTLDHYDPMFQIFCIKGFPLGLDAVAKGSGLSGKTEGMHGSKAPEMWAGTDEDRWKVLEYVAQDAVSTLEIFEALDTLAMVQWTTRSGTPRKFPLDQLKTVTQCLGIPKPDTSWMSNPMTRKGFFEWMF